MTELFNLKNKKIIVTGAAGILGEKFCEALLEAGGTIAMLDMDKDRLNKKKEALSKKYNSEVLSYSLDLTVEDEVNEVVDKINGTWGNIDVLHNNAATKGSSLEDFLSPFEDYKLSTWNEVMMGNVNSMFLMAKAVGKHMVAKESGSIIQTSSIYGVMAPDKRIYEGSEYNGLPISSPAVYSASKAAVLGLSKYLAAYWGDKGIRVNTLTPGGIGSGQNGEFDRKYSNRVPMGRMGRESDLVGTLIYLSSDASSYVTGQNFIVDGGLSCW